MLVESAGGVAVGGRVGSRRTAPVLRRTWALEPIPPRRGGKGTVAYDVDADEEVARDADEEGMRITECGLCCQKKKKLYHSSLNMENFN